MSNFFPFANVILENVKGISTGDHQNFKSFPLDENYAIIRENTVWPGSHIQAIVR
jgi:hypothetical protein